MLLVPLGVSSRECLLRDHSIVRYNIFNQATAAYSAEELTHFRIRIFRHTEGIVSIPQAGTTEFLCAHRMGRSIYLTEAIFETIV